MASPGKVEAGGYRHVSLKIVKRRRSLNLSEAAVRTVNGPFAPGPPRFRGPGRWYAQCSPMFVFGRGGGLLMDVQPAEPWLRFLAVFTRRPERRRVHASLGVMSAWAVAGCGRLRRSGRTPRRRRRTCGRTRCFRPCAFWPRRRRGRSRMLLRRQRRWRASSCVALLRAASDVAIGAGSGVYRPA